jgi:predicted MPP superfamily phosphohydrolase
VNRRRLIASSLGAAGALLAADAGLVEPRRLEVTRHDLHPLPGRERLTLAQITDLHLKRVGGLHHRIAAEVASARPDLILFTGDSVDRPNALPAFREFLSLLDPATPKYAIMGNWDRWSGIDPVALGEMYARFGGRLLVNETAVHVIRGRRIALTGLDDLIAGRPDLRAAVRDPEPADARLLLMHCPEYRDALERDAAPQMIGGSLIAPGAAVQAREFRAMLSGHTHGGQVAILGAAPMLPPGSGRYVRGWFRDAGQVPLYVSRGIGETGLPVRFGSVPELAIFTLAV